MDPNFQLECLAFQQAIALAELEESKAGQRVKELKYDFCRYQLEYAKAEAARNESYRQGVQANA